MSAKQQSAEEVLLEALKETRKTWYKSNERKEQLYERKFGELERWAERVEIYLLCKVKQ
jgi:hypothetical protein